MLHVTITSCYNNNPLIFYNGAGLYWIEVDSGTGISMREFGKYIKCSNIIKKICVTLVPAIEHSFTRLNIAEKNFQIRKWVV